VGGHVSIRFHELLLLLHLRLPSLPIGSSLTSYPPTLTHLTSSSSPLGKHSTFLNVQISNRSKFLSTAFSISVSSFNTPSSTSNRASGNASFPSSSLSAVRPSALYRSAKPKSAGSAASRPVSKESVHRYKTSFMALIMSSISDCSGEVSLVCSALRRVFIWRGYEAVGKRV
jgi:hypothetical protein